MIIFLLVLYFVLPLALAGVAANFIYKGMRKSFGKALSITGTIIGFAVVLVGVFMLVAYNFRIER